MSHMENNSDEPESGYTGDLPSDEELAEYSAAWDELNAIDDAIDDVDADIIETQAMKPATPRDLKDKKQSLTELKAKRSTLEKQFKGTPNSLAIPKPAPEVVFQPIRHLQESRILQLLTSAGYDPLSLPRAKGKAGPKSEIRTLALKEQLFTDNSFIKAWERLRSHGLIVDAM